MLYQRKVIFVDAVQWMGWKKGPHNLGVREYPARLLDGSRSRLGVIDVAGGRVETIYPGKWVLIDAMGNVSTCDTGTFEERYEPLRCDPLCRK